MVLVSRTDAARTVLIDRADVFVKKGTAFFPVRFALCSLQCPLRVCSASLCLASSRRRCCLAGRLRGRSRRKQLLLRLLFQRTISPPKLLCSHLTAPLPPPAQNHNTQQNSSLAGEGLLVSDGDVWRRQRRLSNPAFRKAAVDGARPANPRSTG